MIILRYKIVYGIKLCMV